MAAAAQPGSSSVSLASGCTIRYRRTEPIQVPYRGGRSPGLSGPARSLLRGAGPGRVPGPAPRRRGGAGRAALWPPRGHRRSAGLRERAAREVLQPAGKGSQPVRAARPPTRPGRAPRTPSRGWPCPAAPLSPQPRAGCAALPSLSRLRSRGPVLVSGASAPLSRFSSAGRLAAGGERPGISAV
ncbi:uncharacterized protein LOC128937166 [Melozone crissalis]|uniref:uncharacterized protein LOC128937166 n=1 Tax=Melozone crissalis TaxID=40204 RepID=UPI0023D9F333|nr:uncharacterized protein LOC128937166 [Melozone crissalis]